MHTFICSHQKNGASNLCPSLLMLLSPSSASFHTPPFYLSSYFKHPNLPPSHLLLLHLLPSFLILSVLCTCCFYYQPLAMHIYWLQRSYLIQHVQRVRVNLPPPLAYIQPFLLSLVTQTPIIYCVIY